MPQSKHLPRVLIIGGFSEGRHHTQKLARVLLRSGFVVVKRSAHADIIIGHSGGSYLLPKETGGKLVIMINPPCGYGPWLRRARHKVKQDFQFHRERRQLRHFLHKNIWNFWYIWSRMPHNVRMAKRAAVYAIALPEVAADKVIILVNKHDPWASSMPQENISKNRNYTFLSMEGTHDDLWTHPQRYIDVLNCMYER